MRNYVYAVYRHGSNAANQSYCNKMIVGTVTAGSRKEACERMADKVTVYRNQWLSAVPFSQLSEADQRIAFERDRENQAEEELYLKWLDQIAASYAAYSSHED